MKCIIKSHYIEIYPNKVVLDFISPGFKHLTTKPSYLTLRWARNSSARM